MQMINSLNDAWWNGFVCATFLCGAVNMILWCARSLLSDDKKD
jgi:hypothetical protein